MLEAMAALAATHVHILACEMGMPRRNAERVALDGVLECRMGGKGEVHIGYPL